MEGRLWLCDADGGRRGWRAEIAGGVDRKDAIAVHARGRGAIAEGGAEDGSGVQTLPRETREGGGGRWLRGGGQGGAFDPVAGEVRIGVGLPGEIDSRGCRRRGPGIIDDGFKAGGGGRGRGVADGEQEGDGVRAAQNERFAGELDGAAAPGDVAVGGVALGGGVEGAAGIGTGGGALQPDGDGGGGFAAGSGVRLAGAGRAIRGRSGGGGGAVEENGCGGGCGGVPQESGAGGCGGGAEAGDGRGSLAGGGEGGD